MRYAIAFTTYAWSSFVARQHARLKARSGSAPLIVVADATRGELQIPPEIPSIAVRHADIRRLVGGIPRERGVVGPNDILWWNLDVHLYAVFERFPDIDVCLAADFDACLNLDVDRFVRDVAGQALDLVAHPHSNLGGWSWAEPHRAVYPAGELRACMLAVTVLSRRGAAHLLERRRALAAAHGRGELPFWPFCEAFVPTELARAGFACGELSGFGSVRRYRWRPAHIERDIDAAMPDGFVHPVRPRHSTLLRYEPSQAEQVVP